MFTAQGLVAGRSDKQRTDSHLLGTVRMPQKGPLAAQAQGAGANYAEPPCSLMMLAEILDRLKATYSTYQVRQINAFGTLLLTGQTASILLLL